MKINNPFSKPTVFILIPLILVMVLDLIVTLAGQPVYYWQNYLLFNEGSPLGPYLLSSNPLIFILFFLVYVPLVLLLVANLKRPLNIMVGLGFFLGHAWGASSWVPTVVYKVTGFYFINDWYLIIGFYIILAIISGYCFNLWLESKFKNKAGI